MIKPKNGSKNSTISTYMIPVCVCLSYSSQSLTYKHTLILTNYVHVHTALCFCSLFHIRICNVIIQTKWKRWRKKGEGVTVTCKWFTSFWLLSFHNFHIKQSQNVFQDRKHYSLHLKLFHIEILDKEHVSCFVVLQNTLKGVSEELFIVWHFTGLLGVFQINNTIFVFEKRVVYCLITKIWMEPITTNNLILWPNLLFSFFIFIVFSLFDQCLYYLARKKWMKPPLTGTCKSCTFSSLIRVGYHLILFGGQSTETEWTTDVTWLLDTGNIKCDTHTHIHALNVTLIFSF
jgi:hypothetical protein